MRVDICKIGHEKNWKKEGVDWVCECMSVLKVMGWCVLWVNWRVCWKERDESLLQCERVCVCLLPLPSVSVSSAWFLRSPPWLSSARCAVKWFFTRPLPQPVCYTTATVFCEWEGVCLNCVSARPERETRCACVCVYSSCTRKRKIVHVLYMRGQDGLWVHVCTCEGKKKTGCVRYVPLKLSCLSVCPALCSCHCCEHWESTKSQHFFLSHSSTQTNTGSHAAHRQTNSGCEWVSGLTDFLLQTSFTRDLYFVT